MSMGGESQVSEKRTRKDNLESWISDKPNAQGLYEAKVWMGLKPNGRPDRRHVQRKSLASVKKRVRELENARESGKVAKAGRIPSLQEMLERHLDTVLPSQETSPNTIRSYRSLCQTHIYPRWGGQRADRVLAEDIQDGLAAWRRAGLAASTRRKIFAVLSSAYAVQVDLEALTRNPCDRVKAPKVIESEMAHLTRAEMRSVLEVAAKRVNGTRWTVGLSFGLRQGEALGLRWEYLNLETGEARIWHQVQRLKWAHGCGDKDKNDNPLPKDEREKAEHACARKHCKKKPCPKNCKRHTRACPPPCPDDCRDHATLCPQQRDGGLVFRPIKEKRHKSAWLGEGMIALLKEHRDAQFLQKLTADAEWEDNDLVWCQWNGRPIDPRRDWAEWAAILQAAGLPHHRVHAIRHSAATMLRDAGVAAEVIQEILGHSDIRVTRRYTHTGKGASQDASSRAEHALGIAPEGS